MGSYYEPQEFIDAPVYDSYGYYMGRVCRVVFEPTPRLVVCNDPSYTGQVPDYNYLLAVLRERGLIGRDESPPLEDIVVLARSQGIEIPFAPASRLGTIVKAYVEPSEMSVVDKMEDERLIVLLREPREARLRGLGAPEPARPVPESISGKPVLSPGQGYLGRAVTIALGPGGIALRSVRRRSPRLDVDSVADTLRRLGYRGVAEQLVRIAGSGERLSGSEPVARSLETLGAPAEAVRIVRASVRYMHEERINIPWEKIIHVYDAVITE